MVFEIRKIEVIAKIKEGDNARNCLKELRDNAKKCKKEITYDIVEKE